MKNHHLALLLNTFLGLCSAAAAVPASKYLAFTQDERGTPMVHIKTNTTELFPDAPGPLAGFDIDVGYTNYDEAFFTTIADGLSSTSSTEDKASALVSALYHKTFAKLGDDADMDEDYSRILQMADPTLTGPLAARNSYVTWATGHAIKLGTCAGFLSCISGTTCNFYVTVNKAPRSRCENQGGENCCMSWANYDVKAGFFKATWTTCYNSRPGDEESCEGHDNGSGNGGDVCFSNRADGCT